MGQPWQIIGQRVLVIPDVHQSVEWATAILEREQGNFDHVVFLGDFFDSHFSPPQVAGSEATAEFVKRIIDGVYGPATLLIGNHDLPIMQGYRACRAHKTPHPSLVCSGYSSSTSKNAHKVLGWADWRRFELFKLVNGRLLSHAGFLGDFWVTGDTVENNLDALYRESQYALESIELGASRFWRCGDYRKDPDRKGPLIIFGGPVWCDIREFRDELPLSQIFGHSQKPNTIRQLGCSYCIDGGQSCYLLIEPDGSMKWGSAVKTPISDLWAGQQPNFEAVEPPL